MADAAARLAGRLVRLATEIEEVIAPALAAAGGSRECPDNEVRLAVVALRLRDIAAEAVRRG